MSFLPSALLNVLSFSIPPPSLSSHSQQVASSVVGSGLPTKCFSALRTKDPVFGNELIERDESGEFPRSQSPHLLLGLPRWGAINSSLLLGRRENLAGAPVAESAVS